jgi:tRNA (cytidine/uridine-2'-O-)-methyltransferase
VQVVLVEPQIAPNTGNIIRLCANTGAGLHLVEPLGFEFDDAKLRRGGLDYHEFVHVVVHTDLAAARREVPGRWIGCSASAPTRYTEIDYRPDDVLVFGSERFGLDREALAGEMFDEVVTIPMRPDNRSLNLGNAVSVVVYEAWRQLGFPGAAAPGDGVAPLTVETITGGVRRVPAPGHPTSE